MKAIAIPGLGDVTTKILRDEINKGYKPSPSTIIDLTVMVEELSEKLNERDKHLNRARAETEQIRLEALKYEKICNDFREDAYNQLCRITSIPGVAFIAVERRRQIEEEGWTPEHDDQQANGEMALAAACYAEFSAAVDRDQQLRDRDKYWPWEKAWWKPKTPMRDLIRAGALIAAEIDRRLRLED